MKATRVLASALAIAVALSGAAPAYADEARTTTRTYTYTAAGEDPSQVPSTIEDGEGTWALTHVDVKSKPRTEKARVEHYETRQCYPADLEATKASFPQEMEAEEDGVAATVRLTGVEASPVTEEVQEACNKSVAYPGLPSNDMAQIPGTWSGKLDGIPGEVTLELAGCTWKVTKKDKFGMPERYEARALYRGVASRQAIHHYDVAASYLWEGERPAADGTAVFTVTATYALDAPLPAAAPAGEPVEVPLWLPFAFVGAVAVGGFGFAAAAWRRRNVTYYRGEGGSFEKVSRGRAKRLASGNLALDFPASFDLTKNPYKIELRRDIAGSAKIVVLQRGEPVYEGRANEVIDIAMAA